MSKAADVFAFGMILYEMVMGQRPYAGMSHGQIVHAITANRPPQLGSVCPTPMRKFVLRCLAPQPDERPAFPEVGSGLLPGLLPGGRHWGPALGVGTGRQ